VTTHQPPLTSRRAFLRIVLAAAAGIGLACLTPPGKNSRAEASAARPRPRRADGAPYVADVTHFGAKGDGIADDAAAFQDAVDSLVNTGGVVGAPPGKVYALGSTITIRSKHPIWFVSHAHKREYYAARLRERPRA
jgi:hypothetical protein